LTKCFRSWLQQLQELSITRRMRTTRTGSCVTDSCLLSTWQLVACTTAMLVRRHPTVIGCQRRLLAAGSKVINRAQCNNGTHVNVVQCFARGSQRGTGTLSWGQPKVASNQDKIGIPLPFSFLVFSFCCLSPPFLSSLFCYFPIISFTSPIGCMQQYGIWRNTGMCAVFISVTLEVWSVPSVLWDSLFTWNVSENFDQKIDISIILKLCSLQIEWPIIGLSSNRLVTVCPWTSSRPGL